MKRRGTFFALLAAWVVVLWAVVGTSPIDPMSWEPPDTVAPTGVWAPNYGLANIEVVPVPGYTAPEDVAVAADGAVFTGVKEGRILRWGPGLSDMQTFAQTGGRPLGLAFAPDGRLIVADAVRGLLAIDPGGQIEVLLTEVDGSPIHFADDVDVSPDGLVVLSDASSDFGIHNWKLDILQNRPQGRLITYDLHTGQAEVVVEGLYFANGVAVAADGSFALVSETSRYRIRRVWLQGPRKGTSDIFLDGLPGFPDGVSRSPDGTRFWIAIPSPRNPLVDRTATWPRVRAILARLPAFLQPAPTRHTMVVAVDAHGTVLAMLEDPEGLDFSVNTSVEEWKGWLYLGSLAETSWARIKLPRSIREPSADAVPR